VCGNVTRLSERLWHDPWVVEADPQDQDACPVCGTHVLPDVIPPQMDASPDTKRAICPTCHTSLRAPKGEPWQIAQLN